RTRPASVTRKSRNGNSASTPKNVTDPATSISLSLMNRPFRARKNCFQVTPLAGASMSGLFDDPVRLNMERLSVSRIVTRTSACRLACQVLTRAAATEWKDSVGQPRSSRQSHTALLGLQVATHRDDKVHREYLCMRGRNEPSSGCLP